jgi:tRNA threonylcarbamoyladenosine biosynthesis protein TsaE
VLLFETNSAEETQEAGAALARRLKPNALVLLIGNLGAGKTTIVKGIVEGLGAGVADEVTSPTYTLVHEYGEPVRIYHIDLYRLDTSEEVQGIGIEEILDSGALVLVEWGERFPDVFARERMEVVFTVGGESARTIECFTKSAASELAQAT